MRGLVFLLLSVCSLGLWADDQPILQIDSGGHSSLIGDIAFSKDGRYLVSTGKDKLIRVWDIAQEKTVRTIRGQVGEGPEGKIYAMALSVDNRWLAVGMFHNTNPLKVSVIRLYDFASGELMALLKGHTDVIASLAFSADSRWLVSGSHDKTAIIWNIKQQQQHLALRGHTYYIYAVAFTPDNQRVVTGSFDHSLKLWQRDKGELIATLNGHNDKVIAVAITPDNRIVSGSLDHSIRLWDGDNGKSLGTLVADQGTQIGSLSVSGDGQFVLAGVVEGSDTHLYRLSDGKRMHRYQGHNNIVIATAFSPDGLSAATAGGSDLEIHLWSIASGKRQKRLAGHGNPIWAVGFSEDGQSIAWGKTSVYKHINNRGKLAFQLKLPTANQSLGRPQDINPNSNFIRAQAQFENWQLQHQKGGNYGYDAILAIQHQGETQNTIKRDTTSGVGHRAYTFTPDGKDIISGGMNGVLTHYNRNGKTQGHFIGHTVDIWAVAVSPNGKLLLSSSADQTIRLWDIASQRLLLTLFHADNNEWVAWTPEGYYDASVNGDGMIGWQINRGADKTADYVSASQMKKHFYRPDIIADSIRLRSTREAIAAADNTDFVLADLIKAPPPKFAISDLQYNKTAGAPMLSIALNVDPAAPVDDFKVYIDGRHVAAVTNRNVHSSDRQIKVIDIPIEFLSKEVLVKGINKTGEFEVTDVINLPAELIPQASQQGDLYVLSIGINEYPFLGRGLNYAQRDARLFHQLIVNNASGNFKQVHEQLLVNGATLQPTRRNILGALETLKQANSNDTVVVFLAGHGMTQDKAYYFLTRDSQQEDKKLITDTAVNWQQIQATLSRTSGQRLLVVDTCYADGAFNPRLVKDAFDERIAVFSATDGPYIATELDQHQHGALTWSLLEGLRGKANFDDNDAEITLAELDFFVTNNVKKTTGNRQTPRVVIGHKAKDYVISKVLPTD